MRGKSYHIQTEDWGNANPFLVTRVFANGAVIKTLKTSYQDALKGGPRDDGKAVEIALRRQHQDIIEQLHAGQI